MATVDEVGSLEERVKALDRRTAEVFGQVIVLERQQAALREGVSELLDKVTALLDKVNGRDTVTRKSLDEDYTYPVLPLSKAAEGRARESLEAVVDHLLANPAIDVGALSTNGHGPRTLRPG